MSIRRSRSEPVLCSQPQAALRGGLLASVAFVQCLSTASKSPRCSASELGGHTTHCMVAVCEPQGSSLRTGIAEAAKK
jgi:hypothetical protein